MDNQELIRKVFDLVKKELAQISENNMVECVEASEYVPEHCGACSSFEISKNVISESDVKQALVNGASEMLVSSKAIVTSLADEYARKHNITIVRKA
jgi:ethanolamine utilization protein